MSVSSSAGVPALRRRQDSPLPRLFPDAEEQMFVVKQRFDLQHMEQVLEPPLGLFSAAAGRQQVDFAVFDFNHSGVAGVTHLYWLQPRPLQPSHPL